SGGLSGCLVSKSCGPQDRFRFMARHTKLHSPDTFSIPLKQETPEAQGVVGSAEDGLNHGLAAPIALAAPHGLHGGSALDWSGLRRGLVGDVAVRTVV